MGESSLPRSGSVVDGRYRRIPALIALATFGVYSLLAVRLHQAFETRGYDLGIFGQYAKHLAHLTAPDAPYRSKGADLSASGPNLFGDHVSPILGLLAPLYRLAPHVETLLVLQAALVAGSVFVVAQYGCRRLGVRSGAAIGGAYALSWGVQQLIGFDFHEVAFELPLIAMAVVALLEKRTRAAVVWAAALLLVKEDMGLTVFVFGLLLYRDAPRAGRVLCVLGPMATAVSLFIVIPHFTAAGAHARLTDSSTSGSGLGDLATHPWQIPGDLVWPPVKLVTVLMILLPTAFLAARSRLIVLAVPTLLWRFTADTPNYWGLSFHYSAVLMPIAFLAMIEAVEAIETVEAADVLAAAQVMDRTRSKLIRYAPAFALTFSFVACAGFPLSHLGRPAFWSPSRHVKALQAAVRTVPRNVRVAASSHVVPHLVDADTVYPLLALPPLQTFGVDWVVVDMQDGDFQTLKGTALIQEIRQAGFQPAFSQDDVLVLVHP
ncbi:DUF2079 domain-containing protein [Catenulispora yoronensis]|uniref:DUF2079 domain-containing protein n=1 Tax=Catenulispora yoronensis TaxID=450799 RepID=UPI0031E31CF8